MFRERNADDVLVTPSLDMCDSRERIFSRNGCHCSRLGRRPVQNGRDGAERRVGDGEPAGEVDACADACADTAAGTAADTITEQGVEELLEGGHDVGQEGVDVAYLAAGENVGVHQWRAGGSLGRGLGITGGRC